MNLKKIVGFVAIALVIFFIVTQPTAAAAFLSSIGTMLYNAAQSVTNFFVTLF